MIHLFRIEAPGNDLDGDTFTIQDSNRDRAADRASERVLETFSAASKERRASVRAVYVASYPSRAAYRKAQERAYESGVSLTDGDQDAVLEVLLREDLDVARKAVAS